ncbi:MAG: HNH endonuclease [Lachnospiraceae bacterium]|nr:HNH endonuclease [Lachnospiraceae bacterium]
MQLPYSNELNINYLARLFDNTSECYKFFWFKAILTKLEEGRSNATFEELVNEMVADTWYMVLECHLSLGPKDKLATLVKHISETTGMKSSEKKSVILNYLKHTRDREIMRLKRILIGNVPYRLQSPFMPELKSKDFEGRIEERIARINHYNQIIYLFGSYEGLNTTIHVQKDWALYLQKNMDIIKGWLQYKLIIYLQKRNPSVPGISDKLYPPQERKLEKVREYWRLIMELRPIREIYGHTELTAENISIDHFVPWSYVAHDELWNLHPTTRDINSRKSNRLPDWQTYFPLLCEQEYLSYSMIWQYEKVLKKFNECAKVHLNNEDIRYRLYRKGLNRNQFESQLCEIILPIYNSAKNCGFDNWVYDN